MEPKASIPYQPRDIVKYWYLVNHIENFITVSLPNYRHNPSIITVNLMKFEILNIEIKISPIAADFK